MTAADTTDVAERERLRTFARLVAHQAELADTVEDAARHLIRHRLTEQLTRYAYGACGPYRASRADVANRLRALLVTAAHTAGKDLAARGHPSRLVTPHYCLWVDATCGPDATRLDVDFDLLDGPLAAGTAVRVLVAAANGDGELVGTIACAEQCMGGTQGLVDVLVWLAELGAALTSRVPE